MACKGRDAAAETKMTLSFLDRLRPGRETKPQAVFNGLAQVRAYWEGLRDGASLPGRAALDPRGLGGVLERVFLAERIGHGLAQVRIAGSALADFAGLDLRGLPLSCLFAPESRPTLAQSIERVFRDPAAVEIDLGSDRGGIGVAVARLLLLPLAAEADRRTMLGAISFAQGQRLPFKFQVLARREERLAWAQATVSTEVAAEPLRGYGHLSLVHVAD
jgi:hypothetical protein